MQIWPNKARLFQVEKEFLCLTQGDLDIASYYTKTKQLWDGSRAVACKWSPYLDMCKMLVWYKWKIMQLLRRTKVDTVLMGLNSSYTAIRGSILMMTPFPSMS